MPFPMKIQPLDVKGAVRGEPAKPTGGKSRLKRLFERQFPNVLRISSAEKLALAAGDGRDGKERDDGEPEPSSVCLDRMVLSFIEESNEKTSRCARSRCNCFNGNCDDSSDDEFDFRAPGDAPPIVSAAEILKGLVPCVTVVERNLLADASKIVEKGMIGKGKDDCRRIVTEGLQTIGYNASVCKSRWEKTPSFPAGEYEYLDVIVDGERLLVDVDFRSEFEIARSTKAYRVVLQSLPSIFVGKADRLQQIVAVVSEAARQSLKKKGLHFPPWRKPEYMRAKWLAPYQRTTPAETATATATATESAEEGGETVEIEEVSKGKSEGGVSVAPCPITAVNFSGEFEMRIENDPCASTASSAGAAAERISVVVSPWQPPAVRPKVATPAGTRVVTGLASVLREKP